MYSFQEKDSECDAFFQHTNQTEALEQKDDEDSSPTDSGFVMQPTL